MKYSGGNKMKIIDFEKRGNMIKFYLGANELEDWYGDDWDDVPYEHNAGTVYEEFVVAETVYTYGFDDLVCEPCDGENNSRWCKDDMKARRVPCICILKSEDIGENEYLYDFKDIIGNNKAIKYYFGDQM
jgi:hypothetical protein